MILRRWSRVSPQKVRLIASGTVAVGVGVLLNLVPNLIQAIGWWSVVPLALVTGAAWGVERRVGRQVDYDVAIASPVTVRSAADRKAYGRRGLVALVSLYAARRPSPAAELSGADREAAIAARDWATLDLENSNLQPLLRAIATHGAALDVCWLVASESESGPGSLPHAELVADYVREVLGLGCQVVCGHDYTIALDEDSLVLQKTYALMKRVLVEAADRFGLGAQEVVVDITGGTKVMSLAVILACLSRDRDLEFIGTRYDAVGRPTGELLPIIFSFFPQGEK